MNAYSLSSYCTEAVKLLYGSGQAPWWPNAVGGGVRTGKGHIRSGEEWAKRGVLRPFLPLTSSLRMVSSLFRGRLRRVRDDELG